MTRRRGRSAVVLLRDGVQCGLQCWSLSFVLYVVAMHRCTTAAQVAAQVNCGCDRALLAFTGDRGAFGCIIVRFRVRASKKNAQRRGMGPPTFIMCGIALGIERTRFKIVFSRVRAPQNAQSWCLGRPPSTCAHDYVLVFLASAPKKTRKGRFCVKRVRTANS